MFLFRLKGDGPSFASPRGTGLTAKKRRLELTTYPSSASSTRSSAGFGNSKNLSVNLSWSDVLTMARANDGLMVLVRNSDGVIEESLPVQSGAILKGLPEIRVAIAGLEKLEADFRNNCSYVDNLDPIIRLTRFRV